MNRKMFNITLGVIVLSLVSIAWIPTSASAAGLGQPGATTATQTNSPLRLAAVPSVIRTHARRPAGESPHGPWQQLAPYPIPIEDPAIGCNPATGKVYVADGVSNGVWVTDAFVYDPGVNSWSVIANSPVPRDWSVGVFIYGKFYVANGWGGSATNFNPVTELDIYDPASDSWSTGADNPLPTGGGSARAVINGKLYVVGGCPDGSSCTNLSSALQIYDPATDSWTSGADYPQPVMGEMCGAIQGELYCAGGIGDATSPPYATGYKYDPATDTWSPIADMPDAAWGAAYGVLSNTLVIVGGTTNSGTTNQVQVYDPATDSWSLGPILTTAVYRATSTSCDGHIYIIDGDGSFIVYP